MATEVAHELDPKTLTKEERKVVGELRQVLARWRGKISSLRLAALIGIAFQRTLGAADPPHNRIAKALARGITARQRLALEEDGSISPEEAADLLGISKTAIFKRHRVGRLLAWHGKGPGAFRFPVWQFDDGRLLPGLTEVLDILNRDPRLDDWGNGLFFLQTRLDGRRPLDLLREKKLREVLLTAATYVE